MSAIQGRRVDSREALQQPGDFIVGDIVDGRATLYYVCPCGEKHTYDHNGHQAIHIATGPKRDHYWQWDGNENLPTLDPSIWSKKDYGGCGWHGWFHAGVWRSC